MKTIFNKFKDEAINAARPYCVEVCQQQENEPTEVLDCFWFKTEAEQAKAFQQLTKEQKQ